MTATFIGFDRDSQSTVIYADARCQNGGLISGLGFTFENGKYDAMWDLAQRLTDLGIELEATPDSSPNFATDEVNALLNELDLNDWEADNN